MKSQFLSQSRSDIRQSFAALCRDYPTLTQEVCTLLPTLEEDVALALQYLYATLPLSDLANYDAALFLDFATHGVQLWQQLPQVQTLPEAVYLEYVLQPRVNAEELRPCRGLFFRELYPTLQASTPQEAILAANLWCASHVTYRTSDGRTLSAAATYACGHGRCGEESVFAVNAFRSVGIPARQVYVPRWGHCDDNHAWVEVWCQGQWYFLGACEPELQLNVGWFNHAASRAMMVDCRSFLPYGQSDPAGGMVAVHSQLPRYVEPLPIAVRVLTPTGQPVEGARVDFCLLNMAEFFPIATSTTDATGMARLETGCGSLYLQITHGADYACVHMPPGNKALLTVTLSPASLQEDWQTLALVAPEERPAASNRPTPLTEEENAHKKALLAEADSLRHQRKDSWKNPELERFLSGQTHAPWRAILLRTLSEKDRMDCLAEVLEEHLACAMAMRHLVPEELFVPYVLAPRVGTEILRPYRRQLLTLMGSEAEDFRRNPRLLWQWIDQRITAVNHREHHTLVTTPAACLTWGYGSDTSKKLLFVVAARTLGIPARLHPWDGEMEYWDGTAFAPVQPTLQRNATLVLQGEPGTEWSYFQNWSLGRRTDTGFASLQLETAAWQDGTLTLHLQPGQYRLITTNRLPGGNQAVQLRHFTLLPQVTRQEVRSLRPLRPQDLLREVEVADFTLHTHGGKAVPGSTLTADGPSLLLWLDPGREPTEHILGELLTQQSTCAALGSRLCLITASPNDGADPKIAEVLAALPQAQLLCGDLGADTERLARRLYVNPEQLPLVVLFHGRLKAIYAVAGYQVGTGALLSQLLHGFVT